MNFQQHQQQQDQQDVSTAILNNYGVDCMKCGDHGRALGFFRQALQGTLSGCESEEENEPQQHGMSAFAEHWKNASNFSRHIAPLQLAPSVANNCEYQYLHSQGMYLIPLPSAYVAADPLANTAILSAIILYNLALLFHFKGLEGNNKASEARLNKARSLYLRSKALIENACISTSAASGCIVIDYLCMATLNNLGHVSYQLDDYSGSKACFDQLIQFTLSVELLPNYQPHQASLGLGPQHTESHASGVVDVETQNMLQESRTNFLLNAMSLRRPDIAPAA